MPEARRRDKTGGGKVVMLLLALLAPGGLGACQAVPPPAALPVPAPARVPQPPADEPAVLRGNRFLVAEIQKELKARGYYKSAVDGAFGEGTRAAIALYQQEHELPVDGEPSPALLKHLQGG